MVKNLEILCIVFIVSVTILMTFTTIPKRQFFSGINKTTVPKFAGSTKLILYWIPMWKSETFFFGKQGFELFLPCEIKDCFATHNRKLLPVKMFDAIIFHGPQYSSKVHDMPSSRTVHQRYIFASMEAPVFRVQPSVQPYPAFFNWTMTYRSDSDIAMTYGRVIKKNTEYNMPNLKFIANKTRLIAWVVSNCHTPSEREKVVLRLQNFVNVDIYGRCGSMSCPRNSSCFDAIEKNYKFYLSFENSYCKDYVTEKLYGMLKRDIVPIVYGGADYEKIAPSNSVIIADKYASFEELASHLLFLDSEDTEYLKYFEWKKYYYVDEYKNNTVCQLCKMLHSSLPPKVYPDILYWRNNKNNTCKSQFDLREISHPV